MASPLAGRAVLVLDNEAETALEVANILERAGACVVIATPRSDALDLVQSIDWAAAVINGNFSRGDWSPVYAALAARHIRCIAYTDKEAVPCGSTCMRVDKSFSPAALVEATERLLRSSSDAA